MVDEVPSAWVAEQKLPNPWVGNTGVASGSPAASRRAEPNCRRTSVVASPGPSRSGRPVDPYSSEPPVNTPTGTASTSST